MVSSPADEFCLDAVRGGNLETWWAPLAGGRHALAFFNRSPAADTIAVRWAQLAGLPANQTVAVRDVWARKDLGAARGSFTVTVNAHGTQLFVLAPVS